MTEFATDKIKKLKAQRAAIDARMRQEQQKLSKQERTKDNHRKVLVGAAMMEWAKRSNENSILLMKEMDAFLLRESDRVLFGLTPLPQRKAG